MRHRSAARAASTVLVFVAATCSLAGCQGNASGEPTAATVAAPSATAATAPTSAVTCTESDRTADLSATTWKHPGQAFYAVGDVEMPSPVDLEHLMRADAAGIVYYAAQTLPVASLDAVRDWAERSVAVVALPATETGAPMTVEIQDARLDCDGVDLVQADRFLERRDSSDITAH